MGKPPTHLPRRFLIVSGLVTSWQALQSSARSNSDLIEAVVLARELPLLVADVASLKTPLT